MNKFTVVQQTILNESNNKITRFGTRKTDIIIPYGFKS